MLLSNSTSHRLTKQGTGSPEGAVTALVGTVYVQTDADPASAGLWYKQTGTSDTGWEQVSAHALLSGITGPTVAKTTNYTATLDDFAILGDATSGAISITLPTAADGEGHLYVIKKVDSSGNAVTVDGDGTEEIDGATTKALGNQYEGLLVLSDGTDWHVLAHPLGAAEASAVLQTTIDAKGDLFAGTADNTVGKLTVGTDGLALVAASGETAGLKYATPYALIATETGTTRTLATADAGKYIRYTNAAGCTITVPDNSDDPIPVGSEFHGIGTLEQLEFVEDTSVTINTPETLFTAKAMAAFTLKKVATDEWDLMGYLETA